MARPSPPERCEPSARILTGYYDRVRSSTLPFAPRADMPQPAGLNLFPNQLLREHCIENLLYSRLGRLGRDSVIAYMRADLHALVLVRERLMCRSINEHTGRLLANGAMAHALSTGDHRGRYRTERIIKRVRCGRILRHLCIAARSAQSRHICLAQCDRIVVVVRAAENANRPVSNVSVGDERSRAIRIERHVGCELDAGAVPHLVEAFEACIERRLAAPREPHQRDALRVNA